jgi:hypothetical protein
MSHFARTLSAVRLSAGYRTAYAFYHLNGGRRVFPFTYAYYAKIERGDSLPRPEWLALVLRTMRVIGVAQRARLAVDYLRDLCGPAYEELFASLLAAPTEPHPQVMLRNLRGRLAEHATHEQFLAIAASPEAYGCFMLLVSGGRAMSAGDVARDIGAPEAACAAALRELHGRGLLRRRPGDVFEIAEVGRHYTMPEDAEAARSRARMRRHAATLFDRAGTEVYDGWVTARLPAAGLNSTVRALQEALQTAVGSEVPGSATSEAPQYLVESRIRKLVRAREGRRKARGTSP